MFGFLKKKLKETAQRFSKKVEEASEEVTEKDLTETQVEELTKEEPEELPEVEEEKEEVPVSPVAEAPSAVEDEPSVVDAPKLEESKESEEEQSKGSFFSRIFKKKKSEEQIEEEELFDEKPSAVEVPEVVEEKKEEVSDSPVDVEPSVVEDETKKEVIEEPKKPEIIEAPVKKVVEEPREEVAPEPEPVVEEHKEEVPVESEPESVSPVADSQQPVSKEAVHKELLDEDVKDATKKKKGFFGKIKERIVKFKLTDEAFEELFWDFELGLMENNVALEVIEKIKSDLKAKLTQENVSRRSIEQIMLETLKTSLEEVLDVPTFDLLEKIKSRKSASQTGDSGRTPFVITIIGVNGSGKTTTLAKLIRLFQKNNLSVVVAAADTFRAAAIQQLEQHTTKLGVKLIKHDYNADPSAVAFDAIKHATAKNIDVVLIDTAGRLHANTNLMDELKKLVRVNKPDLSLFVGESITGNDCVEQAVAFNEAVGIDGIILSKADVDDKGGAAISVSYVTGKPILYIGTGQTYDDLKVFEKKLILEALGL